MVVCFLCETELTIFNVTSIQRDGDLVCKSCVDAWTKTWTKNKTETKRTFYENGSPASETDYVNYQRHGKSKGWYTNGKQEYETDYVNGQPHGKARGWSSDGKLIYEHDYANGVKQ